MLEFGLWESHATLDADLGEGGEIYGPAVLQVEVLENFDEACFLSHAGVRSLDQFVFELALETTSTAHGHE